MQWTVRDVPPELDARVRKVAEERGISLNRAVIQVVEEALGGKAPPRKKRDLSAFVGKIRGEDAKQFLDALKEFESVDEEEWK